MLQGTSYIHTNLSEIKSTFENSGTQQFTSQKWDEVVARFDVIYILFLSYAGCFESIVERGKRACRGRNTIQRCRPNLLPSTVREEKSGSSQMTKMHTRSGVHKALKSVLLQPNLCVGEEGGGGVVPQPLIDRPTT